MAIRYTERLAEAGAVRSVGSRADSYDNALAETVLGSTRRSSSTAADFGARSGRSSLRLRSGSTWWNQRRLHSADSDLPPAEDEDLHHRQRDPTDGA